jgi:capsular polysaccharide biosynthesis protein
VTVPDLYRALWRHKLFILVMTSALAVAAWYLTSQQQPEYRASALVRVQQTITDPAEAFGALQTGGRLARTYASIARTDTIARKIYADLDEKVPFPEINRHISARQVEDLELLWITARSRNPERARLIAEAAPRALRSFIEETGTLRDQVITVQAPSRPGHPSSPNVRMNVIIAVVLGLIFNGGLALLIEVLRDRVGTTEELETLAGRPVLTTVPLLDLKRPSPLKGLPAESEDQPAPREDVRS